MKQQQQQQRRRRRSVQVKRLGPQSANVHLFRKRTHLPRRASLLGVRLLWVWLCLWAALATTTTAAESLFSSSSSLATVRTLSFARGREENWNTKQHESSPRLRRRVLQQRRRNSEGDIIRNKDWVYDESMQHWSKHPQGNQRGLREAPTPHDTETGTFTFLQVDEEEEEEEELIVVATTTGNHTTNLTENEEEEGGMKKPSTTKENEDGGFLRELPPAMIGLGVAVIMVNVGIILFMRYFSPEQEAARERRRNERQRRRRRHDGTRRQVEMSAAASLPTNHSREPNGQEEIPHVSTKGNRSAARKDYVKKNLRSMHYEKSTRPWMDPATKTASPTTVGQQPVEELPRGMVLLPDTAAATDMDSVAQSCAICLMEYQDGDQVCRATNQNCPHTFHRDCMEDWLEFHEDCPCCRQLYLRPK